MKAIDLTGQVFGRLTVVARHTENTPSGQARWVCRCSCGGSSVSRGQELRSGKTNSCGCLRAESIAGIGRTVNRRHGMRNDPIYVVWRGMMARCENANSPAFKTYGGRGITVCDEWHSFDRFYADFGRYRPSPAHTIDRIDNNKGYFLDNVRWATCREQQNNRRNNITIRHNGEELTMSQWARRLSTSKTTIRHRLLRGWPSELIVTLPPNPHQRVTRKVPQ
jgi:hypothetical protein